MSIIVKNISYSHANKEFLFENISFTVLEGEKVGLIGANGSGKSTLLRIIAGELQAAGGDIIHSSPLYYIPQHFGQYDHLTVAGALGIEKKLAALHAILKGDVSEENFTLLDDNWNIEESALSALADWELQHIQLSHSLSTLSGGEKTKVFLSGLALHSPEVILMDEPTNHLDMIAREKLYRFINSTRSTILLVSHDITLLEMLTQLYELDKKGITIYGGNYSFYKEQKKVQAGALVATLEEKEKALRLARKTAQETAERKQKLDARGKKHSLQKGVSRMGMNTLRDKAEKSTTRLKEVHQDKMKELADDIKSLYKELPDKKNLKVALHSSNLHIGKVLIHAQDICFSYQEKPLWSTPQTFRICSGERLLIRGRNGSGKTTLLKMLSGKLRPTAGELFLAEAASIYIDQEYSLIRNELTLYEHLDLYNKDNLQEHELKMLLSRFLFPYSTWDKKCGVLSGGEKMRLLLCCLSTLNKAPDIIFLDEPTNNLDIQSSEIILSSLKEYKGTIIAVSHDMHFIREMKLERVINLDTDSIS